MTLQQLIAESNSATSAIDAAEFAERISNKVFGMPLTKKTLWAHDARDRAFARAKEVQKNEDAARIAKLRVMVPNGDVTYAAGGALEDGPS